MAEHGQKVTCEECGWYGRLDAVLVAPNPFSPELEIKGCPRCFSISTMLYVCDVGYCQVKISRGTPVGGEYWFTCSNHVPVESEGEKLV